MSDPPLWGHYVLAKRDATSPRPRAALQASCGILPNPRHSLEHSEAFGCRAALNGSITTGKTLYIYLFIFIFGCVGSSLLHVGFL